MVQSSDYDLPAKDLSKHKEMYLGIDQNTPRIDQFIKDPSNWSGDNNTSAKYNKPVLTGTDYRP